MLAHWIWLAHRPNLSDGLKWQLLQTYGDPEAVFFSENFDRIEDLRKEAYVSLMDKDLSQAQKILETCVSKHLKILTARDPQYPEKLKNIYDPPLILYYKGQLPDFDHRAVIAVVGTRHASPYGLQAAKRLGYQLGRSGGILVSGMAWGVDAMAMQGALMADAPVAGVLGCGADQIYPLRNKELFRDTEQYGCILSEFPPEEKAMTWHFPKRNRIISGLSDGVLVVEAPRKSGALITARQALEQGRDVFVVPGNIGVASCEGSNHLLREGAAAVSCGWDILSEYVSLYPDTLHEDPLPQEPGGRTLEPVAQQVKIPVSKGKKDREKVRKNPDSPGHTGTFQPDKEKLSIDNRTCGSYIDIHDILQKCNSQEKTIVLALADGEALVDTVIAESGLKPQDVLAALTMLEIKGILERLPGRRIRLRET